MFSKFSNKYCKAEGPGEHQAYSEMLLIYGLDFKIHTFVTAPG